MHAIGENIWIVDGEAVPFFTLPYTTRMTVVRQTNYKLWIQNALRLTKKHYKLVTNQYYRLILTLYKKLYRVV